MPKKQPLLLGAHMSIAGGIHTSIIRAESIGCTTMQIFTKSNRSWHSKRITDEEATLFKQTLKESTLTNVMVHSSYLINIGSPKTDTRRKSIKALTEELARTMQLGIPYLVLHPGSALDGTEEECIATIAQNLDIVFESQPGSSKILLETAAGQGTNIGYTFEQLQEIYKRVSHKERVGFCLDTCHIFAAGYELHSKQNYDYVIKEFDRSIGLEHLYAIHLNDSKKECGCRRDRHEKIGKGKIPLEIFKYFLTDKRLADIPFVLETPINEDPLTEYKEEIDMLKKLIQ